MKTLLRLIFLPASIILLAGVLTACINDREEPDFVLSPGAPLPSFSVTLLDGEEVSTTSLTASQARNLIIVFFNTSCGDCRRELPRMQALYDSIRADKHLRLTTRLICIAREESAETILPYWQARRLTMPVAPQTDRSVYSLFASSGIPRIFVARRSSPSEPFIITASATDTSCIGSLAEGL